MERQSGVRLTTVTPVTLYGVTERTRRQFCNRQLQNSHCASALKTFSDRRLFYLAFYEEKASGKHANRAELEVCLKALRQGDTLTVWRLDRLGRSLPGLVKIVADLEAQGVGFESLTEKIETGSAAGKLVFHVFASLADFERSLIWERTLAGLSAARARGRTGGRRRRLDDKKIAQAKARLPAGTSYPEAAKTLGVGESTLYRAVPAAPINNALALKRREEITAEFLKGAK